MPAHTFHALSDADFEELSRDLLGAALGIDLQAFTAGRDSGIDLLYGKQITGATVVQCKHYYRSGYAKLKAAIQKSELPKLAKLKPKRYILATSVGLTPTNKDELRRILAPYCTGIDDIYGCTDLNNLLRAHPEVEQAHYKLWLTSTPVLQRVLHNGRAVWNALEESEIRRKMSLYVQTDAYFVALSMLGKHNYCIVSGIPGIGKTTLAQIVVARLLEDGFELLAVRENIDEAYQLLDLSRRQVVYYDDFLGQSTIGDRLHKNEDQGIVRLLSEAARSKNLKVLLTTREYILADARRLYERLSRPELDVAKCTVTVEQYTRARRARILYNHVYFSDLPSAYVSALLRNRAYRKIVDHKNYSPRIVDWMTRDMAVGGVSEADFPQRFVEALDNPSYIWEHAFDNQLTDDARAVLYCLSTVPALIGYDELREVWESLLWADRGREPTAVEQRFRAALRQLDGSFVRTGRAMAEIVVDFHNPSIRDFVLHRVASESRLVTRLLGSATFFEQVAHFFRVSAQGRAELVAPRLISDGPLLRGAVVRTLGMRDPMLYVVRLKSGGELHQRCAANIGQRLSEAARWCAALSREAFLAFLCETATQLVEGGRVGEVATVEACGFVAAVVDAWPQQGGVWAELVNCILERVGDRLADAPSAQSWVRWTEFVAEHEELLAAEAVGKWQKRAGQFCEWELETIRENANTAVEAEEWLEEVRQVAAYWDIDIAHRVERLREWIDERAGREDDGEAWEGESQRLHGCFGGGGTDAEIDHLFDLLGRRRDE